MSESDIPLKRAWIQRCMIDLLLHDMSDSEIRTFLGYSRHADKSGLSNPGNPTLSKATGLSIRSVQRAVKSLVSDQKLLAKTSKGTGGRSVFTEYRILQLEDPDKLGLCWMPKWIVDYVLKDMTEAEVRVFLVYTRHTNKDGNSFPGNPLIAYKTGLSIRSVQRAVRLLVTKGLLSKVSKGTGGRRVFTVYRIVSQSWIEYQRATHDVTVSDPSKESSEPELSTKGDTPVMVCGKLPTKGDNRESGYCGELPTNHDTNDTDKGSRSEKPCHPCRKTMTLEVQNHDRAVSPEVIKKKVFEGNAVGRRQNHDNGDRQKTATAGIEGMVKKLFRRITSPCNSQIKADKMVRDLHRHLAEQEKKTAGAMVAV